MNTVAPIIEGDTRLEESAREKDFNLHLDGGFRQFLREENISLAFTTYEGGKLIIIGPGIQGSTSVTERNFERCMSLFVEDVEDEKDRNIWISTHHNIWQLENGLDAGQTFKQQWDHVYLRRMSHITGGIDIIDLNTMEVIHTMSITGFVKEIYDVTILDDCKQPLLYGIQQDDIRKIVVLGKDES